MSPSPEVMKWFTRARRFPQLIGRTPDGARIPGGPYTVTQVVGAGVVLFAGTRTMGLWAHYGLLSNAVILLSVAAAVVFGLGKIPVGSRNPLSVSTGIIRALSAPPTGRVAGQPVRPRRPRQVQHRVVVQQVPVRGPVSAPSGVASEPVVAAVREDRQVTAAPRLPAAAQAATPRRSQPGVLTRQTVSPNARAAASAPPTPVPAPRAAPALTAVQALLAQAGSGAPASPGAVLP